MHHPPPAAPWSGYSCFSLWPSISRAQVAAAASATWSQAPEGSSYRAVSAALLNLMALPGRLSVAKEGFVVTNNKKVVAECRWRAAEARRMADAASTPAEKADLLE